MIWTVGNSIGASESKAPRRGIELRSASARINFRASFPIRAVIAHSRFPSQDMQMLDANSKDWCGLEWSEWLPFDGGRFESLTKGPGIYRVRIPGQSFLAYIGQSGRDVRSRLQTLRTNAASELMPYNDPHTAAPSLWAWRDARGYTYECSGAPASSDKRERLALECWLLWNHRLAYGRSTLCNHGHFHPRYLKSGDRKTGRRGGPKIEIADFALDPHPSLPPLLICAAPTDSNWMGLTWSDWSALQDRRHPSSPGLYRLRSQGSNNLLYIGETKSLASRLRAHERKATSLHQVEVSYSSQPMTISKCGLHELENDLIAAYYDVRKKLPSLQFFTASLAVAESA
jgi:hypothetical protein